MRKVIFYAVLSLGIAILPWQVRAQEKSQMNSQFMGEKQAFPSGFESSSLEPPSQPGSKRNGVESTSSQAQSEKKMPPQKPGVRSGSKATAPAGGFTSSLIKPQGLLGSSPQKQSMTPFSDEIKSSSLGKSFQDALKNFNSSTGGKKSKE